MPLSPSGWLLLPTSSSQILYGGIYVSQSLGSDMLELHVYPLPKENCGTYVYLPVLTVYVC